MGGCRAVLSAPSGVAASVKRHPPKLELVGPAAPAVVVQRTLQPESELRALSQEAGPGPKEIVELAALIARAMPSTLAVLALAQLVACPTSSMLVALTMLAVLWQSPRCLLAHAALVSPTAASAAASNSRLAVFLTFEPIVPKHGGSGIAAAPRTLR